MFLLFGTAVQAQIIELEEAKVDYFPELTKDGNNSFSYTVNERKSGDFAADAIGFMNRNFDIQAFLDEIGNLDHEMYEVTFQNSHGYLMAEFNDKGQLLSTRQQFKNILVPALVRTELYKNHKGWTMVKNRYSASGRGDLIEEEMYKIRLENGNKSQTIKIDPKRLGVTGVVSK